MHGRGTGRIRVASCQALLVLALCFTALPLYAADPSDAVQAENAFFRGSNLLSRNNISEAVASLEKAAKLDPQNLKYKSVLAVAYNNLGLKLNREGNVAEGVRFLGKAVNLTPDDKDIRFNFVNAAFHAASLPDDKVPLTDKVAFVSQLMEVDPENPSGRKLLAALLNNSGVAKGRGGSHEQEVAALEKGRIVRSGKHQNQEEPRHGLLQPGLGKRENGRRSGRGRTSQDGLEAGPKGSSDFRELGKSPVQPGGVQGQRARSGRPDRSTQGSPGDFSE